ncbi:hypothetical protein LXL04_014135 [Taraxacum kok-saghyz]
MLLENSMIYHAISGEDGKKRIHWVAWETVIESKNNGGLGIGSLRALNIGLTTKWVWKLRSETDSLWNRIIRGIHNIHNKPDDYLSKKSISGVWNSIAGIRLELIKFGVPSDSFMKKKNELGNGYDVLAR